VIKIEIDEMNILLVTSNLRPYTDFLWKWKRANSSAIYSWGTH